jgi:hypothetical protein
LWANRSYARASHASALLRVPAYNARPLTLGLGLAYPRLDDAPRLIQTAVVYEDANLIGFLPLASDIPKRLIRDVGRYPAARE